MARRGVISGVSLIVLTALLISPQDAIFKTFSTDLTLWQIFALRGLIAAPMILSLAWARGQGRLLRREIRDPWILLRAALITLTFLAFYAALPFSSLSVVGAANYMAPIFVTLLSAYAIREAVGPLGWIGVIIGFVGVVVLLQPGADAFTPWALLPVAGAGCYAVAHIVTRAKCRSASLATLSLVQNMTMMAAGLMVSATLLVSPAPTAMVEAYPYLFGGWAALEVGDWLILMLLAVFAVAISMMLAGAYQAAPPTIVATFEYSYLVFAVVWDVAFFGVTLGASSVAGMALITLAGLLVLRRGR